MNKVVILVCADAEWGVVRLRFDDNPCQSSPFGEYFTINLEKWRCTYFQTGWGKIASAAGTQYAIDRFHPDLLINIGTCGGFSGLTERGQIILVERTIVYDIHELMGDYEAHIAHYSTEIDLSWLKGSLPCKVQRAALVSADRDLVGDRVPYLIDHYRAAGGDWESGAVAWIARLNRSRLLILRGVTDLVDISGSPAYGDLSYFQSAASMS